MEYSLSFRQAICESPFRVYPETHLSFTIVPTNIGKVVSVSMFGNSGRAVHLSVGREVIVNKLKRRMFNEKV